MSDWLVTVPAVVMVGAVMLWANVTYHRIHRHWLKWWAWIFAHGALLWTTRLERWERS